MKATYQILTVVFWITVVYAIFVLIRTLSNNNLSDSNGPAAAGTIVGSIISVAILPTLVYVAKYLVGKSLKKRTATNKSILCTNVIEETKK